MRRQGNSIRSLAAALVAGLLLMAPYAADTRAAQNAAPAEKPAPSEHASKLARQIVDAINSQDRAAQTAFVTARYDGEFLGQGSVDEHVAMMRKIHAQTGGLEIVEINPGRGPDEVRIRARARKGDFPVGMLVVSAEGKPDKIGFFRARAITPPPDITWPETKMSEADAVAAIVERVDKLAAEDRFSGSVLVAKGDKVILSKAVGLADRAFNVPNRVDTKFNLGSMNKMFTSIAIAQLVQAGKLSYDDTIAKVMPDYPNKEVAAKVTIAQMLTHTSGLGNIFKPEFFRERESYKNAKDYIRLCAADPLRFEPGTDWDYSNYGFALLGAIVEHVSGQDYYDYVREHIYAPAGMKDSDSYPVDLPTPNLATGYTRGHNEDPLGIDARRTNVMSLPWRGSPAGGGYSTAPDLLAFARALRAGKLVEPKLVATVTTGKVDTKFAPGLKYGYGFMEETVAGKRLYGHGGGAPGINAELIMIGDDEYTVIVMGNYDPPAAQNVANDIARFLAKQ